MSLSSPSSCSSSSSSSTTNQLTSKTNEDQKQKPRFDERIPFHCLSLICCFLHLDDRFSFAQLSIQIADACDEPGVWYFTSPLKFADFSIEPKMPDAKFFFLDILRQDQEYNSQDNHDKEATVKKFVDAREKALIDIVSHVFFSRNRRQHHQHRQSFLFQDPEYKKLQARTVLNLMPRSSVFVADTVFFFEHVLAEIHCPNSKKISWRDAFSMIFFRVYQNYNNNKSSSILSRFAMEDCKSAYEIDQLLRTNQISSKSHSHAGSNKFVRKILLECAFEASEKMFEFQAVEASTRILRSSARLYLSTSFVGGFLFFGVFELFVLISLFIVDLCARGESPWVAHRFAASRKHFLETPLQNLVDFRKFPSGSSLTGKIQKLGATTQDDYEKQEPGSFFEQLHQQEQEGLFFGTSYKKLLLLTTISSIFVNFLARGSYPSLASGCINPSSRGAKIIFQHKIAFGFFSSLASFMYDSCLCFAFARIPNSQSEKSDSRATTMLGCLLAFWSIPLVFISGFYSLFHSLINFKKENKNLTTVFNDTKKGAIESLGVVKSVFFGKNVEMPEELIVACALSISFNVFSAVRREASKSRFERCGMSFTNCSTSNQLKNQKRYLIDAKTGDVETNRMRNCRLFCHGAFSLFVNVLRWKMIFERKSAWKIIAVETFVRCASTALEYIVASLYYEREKFCHFFEILS